MADPLPPLCRYHQTVLKPYLDRHESHPRMTPEQITNLIHDMRRQCCGWEGPR